MARTRTNIKEISVSPNHLTKPFQSSGSVSRIGTNRKIEKLRLCCRICRGFKRKRSYRMKAGGEERGVNRCSKPS